MCQYKRFKVIYKNNLNDGVSCIFARAVVIVDAEVGQVALLQLIEVRCIVRVKEQLIITSQQGLAGTLNRVD